ncbi:unnamed protein product [Gulo gulo]|uniref:Uncharacterized protein n=1 Tax=Gulo gulo TaxID=48420 RepID=A0A9X9QAH3_GULGU|nr:unnamed protein product [Gulo gulo]
MLNRMRTQNRPLDWMDTGWLFVESLESFHYCKKDGKRFFEG